MASLPTASGTTLFASAAFQKPVWWALNERAYVRSTTTYERPTEAELVGEFALDRYINPLSAVGWFRAAADGKNPDELGDYAYIEDSPETTLTGGVYSTLGTLPPRKRPAEFTSLASGNVITSELGGGATQAATLGMRARYRGDGKTYTRASGSWVLDDPQGSAVDILELPIDDAHPWYEAGDLITSAMLNACKAVIELMKWTFDSGLLIVETGRDFDTVEPGEMQFLDQIRSNFEGDSREANTWLSYTYPSGGFSPSPESASQGAYSVAAGLCATAGWIDRPAGPYPDFTGYGGASAGHGSGPDDLASDDPDVNAANYVNHSVTNPTMPFSTGDTIYRAALGTAGQLKGPELQIYAVVWGGEWEVPQPDPRDPVTKPMARKTEVWAKGVAVSGYDYYDGILDLGWQMLTSLIDDKEANLSATFGPCVVPLPTSPLPVISSSSESAEVGGKQGFYAQFSPGLTKYDVEGGFDYV